MNPNDMPAPVAQAPRVDRKTGLPIPPEPVVVPERLNRHDRRLMGYRGALGGHRLAPPIPRSVRRDVTHRPSDPTTRRARRRRARVIRALDRRGLA